MKRGKNIRDEELEKLKKTPFFDNETLREIRKDLDALADEEIEKSESKIKENTKRIIENVSFDDSVNYFKLSFQ